jgi:hypothetical protein
MPLLMQKLMCMIIGSDFENKIGVIGVKTKAVFYTTLKLRHDSSFYRNMGEIKKTFTLY